MVNNVVLAGRITKDCELKKTPNGLSVTSFTVACNRHTKDGGADFINCVAWRQQADYLSKYAKKGSIVIIEGSIQTRNYDGADGKRVYVTEVVANRVGLAGSTQKEERKEINDSMEDLPYVPSIDITDEDLPF